MTEGLYVVQIPIKAWNVGKKNTEVSNTTLQFIHSDACYDNSPSKDSINPVTCPFPHTVKEAVAIAAGKKENGGDDDDGKTIRSNMLCYLYWLLVVLILGLISFTVWLSIQLARRHSEINGWFVLGGEHRKTFEFEDIFNTTFHPKTFHVTWRTLMFIDQKLVVFTCSTSRKMPARKSWIARYLFVLIDSLANVSLVLSLSMFFQQEKYKSSQYMLSGDLKYVVLQYDNIKLRTLHFGEDKQPGHDDIVNKHLQAVVMAPTSSAAAFVYKNNLFIQASPAPRNPARQLTFSGSDGQVYNGVNDWTYENMLKRSSSIWWSPDSKYFCYLSINDSNVTNFKFILRKEGAEADVISIPHPRVIPYGNIPEVTVRLVDTEKLKDEQHQTVLRAPQEFRNIQCLKTSIIYKHSETRDHYVVNVVWKDSTHVAVVWHTRPHNQSITTLYDVVNEATSNSGHPITFLKSSTSYLTIFPKLESDETLWNHLALIEQQDMQDSKVTYLTAGHQDVRDIVGFDADAFEVYAERFVLLRDLYF
ncbi:hypothetical protein HELRODRAFT_168336 [Helobdella robusta]|uniref:Dipeptidylpeptidase IV N-terminal domain-containing protein n=1 Tax=Helobdella robusta TaxID=6412 RepID=T1F0F9_HELRO|nr:hypothetical protein HELRODRAFT_168336 [Helobdella robusta]ESO09360.1 hypothetical protein HELRODRAFT_168336 [Helobdella robusta]